LILTNIETGEELKRQRTYSTSSTNPRIVSLPDGVYDLEVRPINMQGFDSQTITGIEIKEGTVFEKEVDFGFGELSIEAVRNGKLTDCSVYVYESVTESTVAQGRTCKSSKSNPIVIKLDPGVYDVKVSTVKITNKPSQEFKGIEIKASETVEKTARFSSGVLKAGALEVEKFVDAVVYITDSKTGERIAQGHTYTNSKSNPEEFILLPGSYSVTMKAVKI